MPAAEEDSGATEEVVAPLLGAGEELFEASIPRSLACSAAAVEEELPGAGPASGFGLDVVTSGFERVGWGEEGPEGWGEGAGAEGEEVAGLAAGAGAGLELPPVPPPPPPPALSPPPGWFPPEVSGAPAGAGAATPAGAELPSLPLLGLDALSEDELEVEPVWGGRAGRAGAREAERRSSGSFLAAAIDCPADGWSGSGAGEIRLNPGWAKIATSASPAAAVSPSRAKLMLRIRSGKPSPARLGSRSAESSLLWRLECTSSYIGTASGLKKGLD